MTCLDKGVVEFSYEGVVACLYEGVVAFLENDNKDNFDVDIRKFLMDVLNIFSSHTPQNSFMG